MTGVFERKASILGSRARLYRKGEGKEAKLCYMDHALMENRNGLVVEAGLTKADGHAERHAALAMIEPRTDHPVRIALGTDNGYDAEDFVNELKSMNVTPHVTAKAKGSAIDGRTTRHAGYAISQRIRKRIEEASGWSKTVGPLAKTMLRGVERAGARLTFTARRLHSRPADEAARGLTEKRKRGGQTRSQNTPSGPPRRKRFYPASFFSDPLV
jgi:hypothetical protein